MNYDEAMRDSGRLAEMSYGNQAIATVDLWDALQRRDIRAIADQMYPPPPATVASPSSRPQEGCSADSGTGGVGDSSEQR